ncbi:MAG: DUF4124 domain-containing protein [Usitatibacter sp.]
MNNRIIPLLGLGLALAAFSSGVEAQTLYKLIDKNGKVTYSEKAPKDFDGKVVPMTIDPNANTATLPKLPPADKSSGSDSDSPREGRAPAQSSGDRVKDARKKLDDARKALKAAIDNPGEGEVSRVGNKGGGTRPVFSDGYAARVKDLEQTVKLAEEELKRAEGG